MSKISREELQKLIDDSDLCKSMATQLLPRIWESTIPILVKQGSDIRQHGTGTLLRIADRSFLVTAAHVVHQAREFHLPLLLDSGNKGLLQLPANFHVLKTPDTKPGSRDDSYDLAICELNQDVIDHLGDRTYVRLLDVLVQDDNSEDLYCVAGYPTELATDWQSGPPGKPPMILTKWSFTTALYHDPSTLLRYNQNDHIVLQSSGSYIPLDDSGVPMPKELGGISGCSIWKTNLAALGEKWTPNSAKIVGVQTGVYKKNNTIFAIKGTVWKAAAKLICEAYPDLRPVFGLYLPK